MKRGATISSIGASRIMVMVVLFLRGVVVDRWFGVGKTKKAAGISQRPQ
jgi:hypothetical protein